MERKLGVSVFSSLFMWGRISPVENDLEWQSERKRHFSFFLFHCSFLYFHLFLFLSFHFFLFFLFTFPSPSLSLGNRVLAFYSLSLEEIPLSFASGERMRIPFLQAKVQNGLRSYFNGVLYRGNPILISGAKQIWVSRCQFRAELPYCSIRHA